MPERRPVGGARETRFRSQCCVWLVNSGFSTAGRKKDPCGDQEENRPKMIVKDGEPQPRPPLPNLGALCSATAFSTVRGALILQQCESVRLARSVPDQTGPAKGSTSSHKIDEPRQPRFKVELFSRVPEGRRRCFIWGRIGIDFTNEQSGYRPGFPSECTPLLHRNRTETFGSDQQLTAEKQQ